MVYDILKSVEPLNLLKFFINPHSFSQSIENLFYISFLLRDGRVFVEEEENGNITIRIELITVETSEAPTSEEVQEKGLKKMQNILHFDMQSWRVLCFLI